MGIPGVKSGTPVDIDRAHAVHADGIVAANVVITPVVIAFEVKFENCGIIHGFFEVTIEEGDEDPFLEWLIAFFGDHDHDFASGDPFPEFHIIIHIDRKHRAGGLAKVFVYVIQIYVCSAGEGLDPEGSVDILGTQQAEAEHKADHDDGSHFHDNLLMF